jgi:putative membrane protein
MGNLASILIALVAIEHFLFLIVEMFFFEKVAERAFGPISVEDARVSKVLAGNMGLYNGFLAAGLIWGLTHSDPITALHIKSFFMICVVIAGVYGGYSVKPRVALVQALPAAVALALLWIV